MPVIKSKRQNRWARWAAKNDPNPKTRKAAKEAIQEAHGRKLGRLPETDSKRKKKRSLTR